MPFTLLEERHIPELDSLARLYRHEATGARLLSLINRDENKSFGITFRTPPSRSDGVAHILEHSVLCGSAKYPVKEPFVELMKSSLNTFLNAMTFPDKTAYPVASTNLKDFRNLVDVYLDAVFSPLLTEDTFRQEGWHYEVDAETGELSYKGVVFNEMKGAYSDPDDIHSDLCRRSLFPDTAYGLDSGGDPRVIPSLDYTAFRKFHETYYHPTNSFIFFYGDDDPEERLAIIERRLEGYSRREVDSLPRRQDPFTAPVRTSSFYPSSDPSIQAPKAWVAVNWAQAEHGDTEATLALSILSHILIATPASPLRKALIDSGLGEDLAGFGFEEGLANTAFSVGLKGVDPGRTGDVETLIRSTLERLVKEGIEPATVAASLNTIEFTLRERNTGRFPRGLSVMFDALNEWLYERNPLDALSFSGALGRINAAVTAGDRYFERLIDRWLLSNRHMSVVTLLPDPQEEGRKAEAERAALAAARSKLDSIALEEIRTAAARLERAQRKPDSPQALATIPSLKLADIDRAAPRIPTVMSTISGAKMLFHDLATSSILYFDAAFPLDRLEERLLPYAGIFGRALLEMGTSKHDFVAMSQRIGTHTGGIGASAFASARWNSPGAVAAFVLRGKVLAAKAGKLFELLGEILLDASFGDRDRFRKIVLEEKSQAEASLIPSGHGYIAQRLKSRLDEAGAISEKLSGIEQLFFLRELARRIDDEWPAVLEDLELVRRTLLVRDGAVFNATIDSDSWGGIEPQAAGFISRLPAENPAGTYAPDRDTRTVPSLPRQEFEALSAPTQVNFVGMAFPVERDSRIDTGAYLVARKYLNTTYLWERIRVQGGAYGGFCTFDLNSGVFLLLSYRDPNIEKTLDSFSGIAEFLKNLELSAEELERTIIGTIGSVDPYLLPDAKGFTAFAYHLTGFTWEDSQRIRDEILAAGTDHLRRLGAEIAEAEGRAIVALLSSPSRIEALPGSITKGSAPLKVL